MSVFSIHWSPPHLFCICSLSSSLYLWSGHIPSASSSRLTSPCINRVSSLTIPYVGLLPTSCGSFPLFHCPLVHHHVSLSLTASLLFILWFSAISSISVFYASRVESVIPMQICLGLYMDTHMYTFTHIHAHCQPTIIHMYTPHTQALT